MATSIILVLVIITILFNFRHYAISKKLKIKELEARLDIKKTNEDELLNIIRELASELRETNRKLIDATFKLRQFENK